MCFHSLTHSLKSKAYFNDGILKCVFSNQLLYLPESRGMDFMQNLHTYTYKYVVNNQSAA